MAVTEYKAIIADTPDQLSALVTTQLDTGFIPFGNVVVRNPGCFQIMTKGYANPGYVNDYQIVVADTLEALTESVTGVLSATVQPIGEPIVRQNTLIQVLGKIVEYPTQAPTPEPISQATTSKWGVVKMAGKVDNIGTQTVTGADAEAVAEAATTAINAVGKKVNDLMIALRAAGIQSLV